MNRLRNGHAPGHIRDAFLGAVDAFLEWDDGKPEPHVDVEVRYVPRATPISCVCGMLWNCTDIIPGDAFDALADRGLALGRRTYAACARAMRTEIARLTATDGRRSEPPEPGVTYWPAIA